MQIANFRLQIAKVKIFQLSFFVLPFSILLSGCVAFRVGGEVQRGRQQLIYGDPKVALAHFQRTTELDPDYLLNLSILPQGVWTYVGRAYYAAGNFPEARRALEKARSRYDHDNLAKLYLGLVLARGGERERGLREIEAGLRGSQDWLDHIQQYHPDGRFWDPSGKLRAEIQKDLAMIRDKDIDWSQLISSGEWLGRGFEEEIDLARKDKRIEETHDGDDNDAQP